MKVEDSLGWAIKLRAIKIHAINIQPRRVRKIALACNFLSNFSRATRKLLTKLHSLKAPLDYTIKIAATWVACKKLHARIARPFKGLLDYAMKIAATWVACKKLHARIARPFTLRFQHRAILKRVSLIGFSTAFR